MKPRIGIFSGSFNPVHIGHLVLANYLCEFEGLDEVWFMVSPQNPLKKQHELLPDTERLNLVRVAIQGYSKFRASDFEFSLPRPSYTINTLTKLKEAYPDYSFELIIGSDNWITLYRWKDAQQLIADNKILIYPRRGFNIDKDKLPPTVQLTDAPLMDISSTFIRESLAAGKDVRYFLHPEVYKRIMNYEL